jgi:hypothetical protein
MKINLKSSDEPGYVKAERVEIITDSGVWHFGVDNHGNTYVASDIIDRELMAAASNRVIIKGNI